MEVITATNSGFCFGVNNAVTKTKKLLETEKNIYCLGELVHNKQVIQALEQKGLIIIDSIEQAKEGVNLIIRAHGEPPKTYKKVEEKQITLHDFTCPKVKQIHKDLEEINKSETYILIIGEKEHPEVTASIGYSGKNATIIQTEEDINEAVNLINETNIKKIYITSQTTCSKKIFDMYTEIIKNKLPQYQIEIRNRICNATRLRQDEIEKLSKQVDYMVIIGGKNSANTIKLYEIAKENCKSIHIQTKDDLDLEEIKKYKKIGITAGASTPQENISEIEEIIRNLQ